MLADCDTIAFLATVAPERALAFYRDKVGLKFVADTPYALVFEAGGRMLRIQKVDRLAPQSHTALGWRVDNIGAAMANLTARGVRFETYAGLDQDAEGIWTTPDGAKVAWFRDPDGAALSLTEFR